MGSLFILWSFGSVTKFICGFSNYTFEYNILKHSAAQNSIQDTVIGTAVPQTASECSLGGSFDHLLSSAFDVEYFVKHKETGHHTRVGDATAVTGRGQSG